MSFIDELTDSVDKMNALIKRYEEVKKLLDNISYFKKGGITLRKMENIMNIPLTVELIDSLELLYEVEKTDIATELNSYNEKLNGIRYIDFKPREQSDDLALIAHMCTVNRIMEHNHYKTSKVDVGVYGDSDIVKLVENNEESASETSEDDVSANKPNDWIDLNLKLDGEALAKAVIKDLESLLKGDDQIGPRY